MPHDIAAEILDRMILFYHDNLLRLSRCCLMTVQIYEYILYYKPYLTIFYSHNHLFCLLSADYHEIFLS